MDADRRAAALWLAAAGATLGAYLIAKGSPALPWVVLVVALAWGAAAAWWLARGGMEQVVAWGFRPTPRSWKGFLAVGALGAAAIVILWLAAGRPGSVHIPPAHVALYAAWALAQQFAIQNVVALPLARLGLRASRVVLLVGLAVALGHVPSWQLGVAAGTLASLLTWRYLASPNLWAATLVHAALGLALHALLLQSDPAPAFLRGVMP